MASIPQSLERLDPERSTVCLCHHGARSMQVALYLENQGFSDVINLTGGIHAWSVQVDPQVRIY
jgi:rhodanese-related sulfurtransferase